MTFYVFDHFVARILSLKKRLTENQYHSRDQHQKLSQLAQVFNVSNNFENPNLIAFTIG
jgi:hypothetical protein